PGAPRSPVAPVLSRLAGEPRADRARDRHGVRAGGGGRARLRLHARHASGGRARMGADARRALRGAGRRLVSLAHAVLRSRRGLDDRLRLLAGLLPPGAGHLDPGGGLRRAGQPSGAPRAPVDRMRIRILQLVTVVAGLAAWELAARSAWVDPLFVPAPSAVAPALLRIGGDALAGLADTLGKTALAYVLSVVLGVSA